MTHTIESRGLMLHVPESPRFAMRNETWDGEDRGNEMHFLTCGWTLEGELDPQWIPVRRILAGEGGEIFLQDLINCARCAWLDAKDGKTDGEWEYSTTEKEAIKWAKLSRLIEAEKGRKT